LLVDSPDEILRKNVMAALDEVLRAAKIKTSKLPLSDRIVDVAGLESRLVKHAHGGGVVHVIGRSGWFDAARWQAFNLRRERIAQNARARLVFWLDAQAIALASRSAPDLWSWRGGIYTFVAAQADDSTIDGSANSLSKQADRDYPLRGSAAMRLSAQGHMLDNRSMIERSRRIVDIRAWLERKPSPPSEMLADPIDELGHLLFDLGEYDKAIEHWRSVELPYHERIGDERAWAITQSQIADVLTIQGNLDEALRIRREVQLPVFMKLHDDHQIAFTFSKIADILEMRGDFAEALRIRIEEELPIYERLGDSRAKAITSGHIADDFQRRGQFDKALQIQVEGVLPEMERSGSDHDIAVTKGRIADVLEARGELGEALRIRQQEVLPVYERLGDVRGRAVTMGTIADILQARGQIDEVIRIRTEEELPILERLGEKAELAITRARLAQAYLVKGQTEKAVAMLDLAEAGFENIGQQQGVDWVRHLRRQLAIDAPVLS
jgi:tetratricopeptide (TPR) repeat protein